MKQRKIPNCETEYRSAAAQVFVVESKAPNYSRFYCLLLVVVCWVVEVNTSYSQSDREMLPYVDW